MNVLVAPEKSLWRLRTFLAGGISNCRNWQDEFIRTVHETHTNVIFVNPRREQFDVSNEIQTDIQIEWEYKELSLASLVVFYFCEETVCPIALYELGFLANSNKNLIVGYDPNYSRRLDIVKQLSLARPDVTVCEGLDNTIKAYKEFLDSKV